MAIMTKQISWLWSVAFASLLIFGGVSIANAQQANQRQVRDAVRSINSKLDHLEAGLRYQMQSNSASNGQVSQLQDDVRELRDRVLEFEDNMNAHRENRDDVKRIVDSAARLNETVADAAPNRNVESDMRAIRDQVDRLRSEEHTSELQSH